jgi:hypothetical protein
MPEPIETRWPDDVPTAVHPLQAHKAFGPDGGAYPARLLVFDGGIILERVPDEKTEAVVVARPDQLREALDRADVTMLRGAPLALFSERFRVLAIATGPPVPPGQLRVLWGVARFEGGEAVELPAHDAGQPSWQLFAARVERA